MRYPIEPIGVSPREAGEILRGSRSTVYRLLARGELQAVKRGTATLVLTTSIRAYQESLPRATFSSQPDVATDTLT
jgi:excisionase family DNA binding protein